MTAPFAAAFAEGDPATLAASLLAQLPQQQEATLGILYVSEPAAAAMPRLVEELAAATGIALLGRRGRARGLRRRAARSMTARPRRC